MPVGREAFTSTRTEEERAKDKDRVLSLRLNPKEQEDLEADMRLMDVGVDAACAKLLMQIGRNVIRDRLGEDAIKYLVSRKRTRFDARKR